METTEETPTGLDIAAASEQLGKELFPSQEPPSPETGEDDAPAAVPPSTEAAASTPTEPTVRPVPKSWAKEVHDYWTKIDPKAQEYIEKREKDFLDGLEQYKKEAAFAKQIQESLNPYRQTLQSLRVSEVDAIKALFNADHLLRTSPAEQKRQHFEQLAKNYGLDLSAFGQPQQPHGTPVDPIVQQLKQEIESIKSITTAQQQAALQEARMKADSEVAAFAADEKAHPYFNDVADQMTTLLKADPKLSLQDAYDQAVWLNPVTREKEKGKHAQAELDKFKENARLEALPKKKASTVNVKSRDTQRTPTEPLGTMDDTMKATLAKIRAGTS
jgi:hypothetical protein